VKRLHHWIEKKTGFIFGTFRSPEPADYRVIFRLGFGRGSQKVNVEAGVAGRNVYFDTGLRLRST
jgi:hypothetical protein